ncbi:MAG: peptidoglycan-binding domain-containing protein [Scytonema sp. PMC 1069.18]|nr:peptidoglycan-binding domain-containing protein [Scytonema sp. PMC 1069.18]MEC4887166.1 peptidoglycan-binding domain-containing protein [Scytonema sp. PMC 1070.18]
MVSLATSVQEVAQAVPKVGINRPTLKVGSQGVPVSELQAALKLLGFYTGEVDGVYNENTAIAVSRFQEAAGLNADGVVNDTTWERLFPPIASSSSPSPPGVSKFPTPSQISNTSGNNVVIPTSNRTTTTATSNISTNTSTATSKPEPKPTETTRVNNPKPKPKPKPKPTTRAATANTQKTSTQQTSSTRRSSNSSRQTTRGQQTARAESSTRVRQNTRAGSSTRTQQTAYVQYTSAGLPILRMGMQGSEVVKLQRRLQRLGFLRVGDIDGDFGETTQSAVIAFQKRNGLEADGVVGGATWDALTSRR